MGPIEARVESVKFFRKQHYVPMIRLGDERDPFHLGKVVRPSQRDAHAATRVRAVRNDVPLFQTGYPGIFHAELFIGREWALPLRDQKGLGVGWEPESVAAAGQSDNRSSGAQ